MTRKRSTWLKLLNFSFIFLFFSIMDSGAQVKKATVIDKASAKTIDNAAAKTTTQVKTATLKIQKASGAATKLGSGDSDVGSKKNEKTNWELKVDLVPKDKDATGAYKGIDAVYVFTVKEQKKDYTHLEHRATVKLPVNFSFNSLDGQTSQTVSGTITGEQHNLVSVSVPANGLVSKLSVKIDSNKGDDRGEIDFSGELNVKYTEKVAITEPKVTAHPANATIDAGKSVTFTVTATGNPEPTYEWHFHESGGGDQWLVVSKDLIINNKKLATFSGYDTPKLTITDVSAVLNNSKYRCRVRNSIGLVYSNEANLTIKGTDVIAPKITTQPLSATTKENDPVSFTVAATGDPAPTYMWYVSNNYDWRNPEKATWTPIVSFVSNKALMYFTGATTNKLTITSNLSLWSTYGFRCTVTNKGGSVNSDVAAIKYISAPVIVYHPKNITTTAGKKVSFSSNTTIATGIKQQWQFSKDGKAWSNVSDAAPYSFDRWELYISNTPTSLNGYKYRCVFTNDGGSVTSNVATLTVNSAAEVNSGTINLNFTRTSKTVDYYSMNSWSTIYNTAQTGTTGVIKIKSIKNTSNYQIGLCEIVYDSAAKKNVPKNLIYIAPGTSSSAYNNRTDTGITFFTAGPTWDGAGCPPEGCPSIEINWSK